MKNEIMTNENKGFSLVELIVVIAIMAVMTSVLVSQGQLDCVVDFAHSGVILCHTGLLNVAQQGGSQNRGHNGHNSDNDNQLDQSEAAILFHVGFHVGFSFIV